jgi:hypothetical protein
MYANPYCVKPLPLGYYDNKGTLYALPRPIMSPVVAGYRFNYVTSLADTGRARPSEGIRASVPNQKNSGMSIEGIITDATLFFTVVLDVTLRMPFYTGAVRANTQGVPALQTYEPDISGLFTNGVLLLGHASAASLGAAMAAAAASGQIPDCGALTSACVPSGIRQSAYPYDHAGVYPFSWPSIGSNGDYDISGGFAAYDTAAKFVPGYVGGYSLQSITPVFSMSEYRFDYEYVVRVACKNLYRMHTGTMTALASDLQSMVKS